MGRLLYSVFAASLLLFCETGDCKADEQNYQASSREFTGPLDQVVLAIKTALGNGAYHGKDLVVSPYDYVRRDEKVIGIPVANRWRLFQGHLPLTLLPRGRKMLAYFEDFEIKAERTGLDTTKVSVRPSSPFVREDRYELSMHLDRVLSTEPHPPLASEATKLFLRIQKQLEEIRNGRTNALPPTPDTQAGFYKDFWTKMDTEDQHDPHNWKKMVEAWKGMQTLQAGTNSAGTVDAAK